MLLGASRAAIFAALVPAATLVVGFLALDEAPSMAQVGGLAIVLVGFHLTQKTAAPPGDHCVFRWRISHCKSWRRE